MTPFLRTLAAYLKLSMSVMFQYRGEIVLWAVWGVVYPSVAIALWSAAAEGNADANQIGEFGPREFAAYFLLTMIVGHLCTAWDIYEMGYEVRSGRLSTRLLRPILPLWEELSDNLAYKLLTLLLLVPLWLIVAWLTEPWFTTTGMHLLVGIVATVLGSFLNFLLGYTLATSAFWITRTDAVAELWFGLSLFFGGRLAPLAILPDLLQWFAAFLPFKWIIWFPSETLMGRLSTSELLWGLVWQIGWLAAGFVAFRFAWPAGVKRYSAVGA